MPTDFIAPFDFRTLYINYFLGSGELFAFAFIILVGWAGAYFQMPNRVFLTILIVCSLIMGAFLGQALYILMLIIVGFVIFKGIARFGT